jgi:hypothetical protein
LSHLTEHSRGGGVRRRKRVPNGCYVVWRRMHVLMPLSGGVRRRKRVPNEKCSWETDR